MGRDISESLALFRVFAPNQVMLVKIDAFSFIMISQNSHAIKHILNKIG